MKKRKAEERFGPAIPPATREAYIASVLGLGPRSTGGPIPSYGQLTTSTVTPMGEFTAPGFSIEPVRGARSFDVDKLGRLRGVTYDQVWTPGENEATCRVTAPSVDYLLNAYLSMYPSMYSGYVPSSLRSSAPKDGPAHSLVGCKHGFYGYYDGSDDYYKPERVSAVIEGYGEVVIGTRGFRATKARIVALTIPDTVPAPLAIRVRRNYDVPTYATFAEMVAAHPTDTQHGPTPETDADFWTREAP